MLGVYPLNLMPMVAPLRQARGHWSPYTLGATVAIVIAAWGCAAFVTDLGPLNAITGSITCATVASTGPGLVGLHMQIGKRWHMITLIVFGVAVAAAGLLFHSNMVDSLTCVIAF